MIAAQSAVHDRARLACAAATTAGLPGRFFAFAHDGLLATLTTAPEMLYLNQVTGVSADTIRGVPDILETYKSAGAASPSLTVKQDDATVHDQLRGWCFRATGQRPIASIDLSLDSITSPSCQDDGLEVQDAEDLRDVDVFLAVLSAGYAAPTAVSHFMAAEHSVESMHQSEQCSPYPNLAGTDETGSRRTDR